MIELRDIRKQFGSHEVLRGVNLQLEGGKAYGIVGENGAGKTTLFRCIAGLESHQGEMRSELKPLRDHLGYLPTDPYFFPKLTGMEYLRFVCQARGIAVPDLEKRNVFDLPLGEYATSYSTGMKKKLALLGLLLQGNQVLVLDEPFNGLDIHGNLLLTGILQRLRELGRTLVVASHIFSTLTEVCDEIHLLQGGVITQRVTREGFGSLDQEMRAASVEGRLERLGLE